MSDSQRTISYRDELPGRDAYFQLFECTGWNRERPLTADRLFEGVRNGWFISCAYDGDALVGSARLVSDTVVYAVVMDVIVLPSHRRLGIGRELMLRLLRHCQTANIRHVQLFCARGYINFYEQLGFVARRPESPAMTWVPRELPPA